MIITVTPIKSVSELPKVAGKVRFVQGIQTEEAARNFARKHNVLTAYWLKKQERAYVFVEGKS